MSDKQSGIGAVAIVAVLTVVAVVGIAGWVVWDKQKSDDASSNQTAQAADQNSIADTDKQGQPTGKTVELAESKLPEGWTATYNEATAVSVMNQAKSCYVNVSSATDTAESNSPDIDHNKQLTDGLQAKGYTVKDTTKGSLTVATDKGDKSLETVEFDAASEGGALSYSAAFIPTTERYTSIQLYCAYRPDLQEARQALAAVKLYL